jgi:hypothetical protein
LQLTLLHYHQEHGTEQALEMIAGLMADALDTVGRAQAEPQIMLAGDGKTPQTQWKILCRQLGTKLDG